MKNQSINKQVNKMSKRLLIIAIAIFGFGVFNSQAQTSKIGHVDYAKVLDGLPTKVKADEELQIFLTDGKKTLADMQAQLETDYAAYLAEQEGMSAILREMKEKALNEQNQILEMKKQTLESDLSVYNERLYGPLEANLTKAVKIVADKHKLNYILEANSVLYVNGGTDLTQEVKNELRKLETARMAN
jgi:outer membrane protein